MRIHLIRHGDANPHGRPTWTTDDERPLSRKGARSRGARARPSWRSERSRISS
jgi:phosphohistidine phosphatase SixA